MASSVINKLGELASSKDALAKIGNQIVLRAVEEAAAERLGLRPTKPDVVRKIAAGQRIPADIVADRAQSLADGTLANGWEKTWTNLGIWDRNWSENESGMRPNVVDIRDDLSIIRLESVLDPSEIATLEKLNIIRR